MTASPALRAIWHLRGTPVRQADAGGCLSVMMATIGEPEVVAQAGAALQLAEETGDALQIINSLEVDAIVLSLFSARWWQALTALRR